MKIAIKKRKGATLAELSIVLAVVAIITVIIASFSVMVNRRVKVAGEKLKAMEDISVVEAIVEEWISRQTQAGAVITVDESDSSRLNAEAYVLKFENNEVLGTVADGDSLTYLTERIDKLEFEIVENEEKTDALYFCKVTYTLQLTGSEQETHVYTFTVNPYVGEAV